MSLEDDIKDTRSWLDHQRGEYISSAIYEDLDSHLEALDDCATQAKMLEALLKQAHELLTLEWQPDDVDRNKFLVRLERAIP